MQNNYNNTSVFKLDNKGKTRTWKAYSNLEIDNDTGFVEIKIQHGLLDGVVTEIRKTQTIIGVHLDLTKRNAVLKQTGKFTQNMKSLLDLKSEDRAQQRPVFLQRERIIG